MNENENYIINDDLNENIIQTDSLSIQTSSDNNLSPQKEINTRNRKMTVRKTPSEIISEFLITSIIPSVSTINEILNIKEHRSNEDIIIFEITGKNNVSTSSWKIYKNHKQIRELFSQTKKELIKKNLINEELSNICKTIIDYTNGEIFKNIDKIAKDIMNLYNNTPAKKCDSFRQGLRISATSFIYENNGIKPFEGFAYKKAEPRCMRTIFKIKCKLK